MNKRSNCVYIHLLINTSFFFMLTKLHFSKGNSELMCSPRKISYLPPCSNAWVKSNSSRHSSAPTPRTHVVVSGKCVSGRSTCLYTCMVMNQSYSNSQTIDPWNLKSQSIAKYNSLEKYALYGKLEFWIL